MAGKRFTSVQDAIIRWDKGGKEYCLKTLQPHVLNPESEKARDALFNAFYLLVSSATTLVDADSRLATSALATLILALAENLPSTSAESDSKDSTLRVHLGDVLLDSIWTVDTELDDTVVDGAAASSTDKQSLVELLQELLTKDILRPAVCRERLEFPLLSLAGLVDEPALKSKTPRVRTANLFKQRKFNLLRETNEGYSKLIVEITSLIGSPHSPETGRPIESRTTLQLRAKATWEKVVGFIGYFDLDPNRVLDVILDVFSANIVFHHAFFLELIRCSGWSRMHLVEDDIDANAAMMLDDVEQESSSKYEGMAFQDVLKAAQRFSNKVSPYVVETETPIISDILGFKYAHYQHPDSTETTARQLYYLTALLIREHSVKLEDVYHHLTPFDADLAKMEEKQLAAARQKLKAPPKLNALATAAALETTSYRTRTNEPTKSEVKKAAPAPKEPPNQKLGLLKALLALGALQPAFSILAKFPWMVQAYPEVADLILRIIDVSIQPMVDRFAPSNIMSRYASSNALGRQTIVASTSTSPAAPRPVLVLQAPTPVDSQNRRNVFFFPDWTTWIPICSTMEDFLFAVQPMINVCGMELSRNVELIARLCKVGKAILQQLDSKTAEEKEMSEQSHTRIRQVWADLVRLYLLPATSLIPVNPAVAVEVWGLVSMFGSDKRWAFYDEWRKYTVGGIKSRPRPELVVQGQETSRETKDILRRLNSNTTGRMFSQPISRMTHSNAVVVFPIALKQVLSYPNFPAHIADALEYLTPLGFDILTYSILNILADPDRQKVKADGTSLEDWIHNLASFTGKMLRGHVNLDPELILEYILHQLHGNSSKEILLLREVISSMTSIETPAELNEDQINAYSGGPLLVMECVSRATRGSRSSPYRRGNTEGMRRIIQSLTTGRQLALPLLIALAQYRALCSYRVKDGEWHSKYLSQVFDDSHGVLLQFVELLSSGLTIEEYTALLPSFADLCTKFGLEPSIAFIVLRPVYEKPVLDWSLTMHTLRKEAEMKEKARASRLKHDSNSTTPANGTATGSVEPLAKASTPSNPPPETWCPLLAPLEEDVHRVLPPRVVSIIGSRFYVTFWQMSLADIVHPMAIYETTMRSLEAFIRERGDEATYAERTLRQENRKLSEQMNRGLTTEVRSSLNAYEAGRSRMAREKSEWFRQTMESPTWSSTAMVNELVQHCFHPRSLLSPVDAEYCAKLIKILHKIGTPGFSTAICYDKIIGDQLASVISLCSDKEIVNYSRLLRVILTDLDAMHASEAAYVKESRGSGNNVLPGFLKKGGKFLAYPNVEVGDILTYTEFTSFVGKLHKKMLKAAITCLESNNYRSVKNMFLVLSNILSVFPLRRVSTASANLETAVKVFLTDERNDIKILATGYYNKLEARREHWDPKYQADSHKVKPEVDAKAEAPRVEVTQPTPTPTSANGLPARPGLPSRPGASSRPAASNAPSPAPGASTSNGTQPRNTSSATIMSTTPGTSTRPAESIPRPEFIKRVRSEILSATAPAESASRLSDTTHSSSVDPAAKPATAATEDHPTSTSTLSIAGAASLSLPEKPKESSSAPLRRLESRNGVSETSRQPQRPDGLPPRPSQEMPPPSGPSTKPTAEDLRANAKGHRDDDDRGSRSKRRSPPPSGQGSRAHSSESRASGEGKDRPERNGRDREDRSSRRYESESERDTRERGDISDSRKGDRARGRDDRGDRDREREKDKERDRERPREREKSGRDRDRGDHHRSKKDRDRDIPSGPAPRNRRDDDRSGRPDGRNDYPTPGRDEAGRSRPGSDEASHKRRREDDDVGPSKRLRESGADSSRQSPTDGASSREVADRGGKDDRREVRDDGRDTARRYSPNGRDRYKPDNDREQPRRPREGDESRNAGREDSRAGTSRDGDRERDRRRDGPADRDGDRGERGKYERPRDGKEKERDKDRDRERDRERDATDTDRRDKDERPRRDPPREPDRDRDKDRSEASARDAYAARREKKEREAAAASERDGRDKDRREVLDKPTPASRSQDSEAPLPPSTSSNPPPPSGPRAMNRSAVLNESPRPSGMRSDSMTAPVATPTGPAPRGPRGPGANGPSSLLNRIALQAPAGPGTRGSRSSSQAEGSSKGGPPQQDSPSTGGPPSKRTPVESPTESGTRGSKRFKLNRNFADGR